VNGNDLGLYWLIQGSCPVASGCLQSETLYEQPSQRYYHIPSDWLIPKNNLLTVLKIWAHHRQDPLAFYNKSLSLE
jgi:hypothetical protein